MAYCTLADLKEQIKEDELAQITDDRVNLASGVLNGAIDAAVTSITLDDSTAFPSSGRVQIDYEVIDYTANSGTVLSGCTRGSGDTLAAAHSNDAAVSEKSCIDESRITRAIIDADSFINGYIETKYDTPLSPVPEIIRKISVDVSIKILYQRRLGVPQGRKDAYDEDVSFLKDISRGLVSIGGTDAPAEDDDAGPEATTVKSDRIFTMGWASDSSVGSLDNF
jgi:phage gp36-like protein